MTEKTVVMNDVAENLKNAQNQKVLQIPEQLLNSKEYKKLAKIMGEENCREFFQKSDSELRATMAECQVQVKEEKNEVEANENVVKSKATLKLFGKSLRDALAPLYAKIAAGAATIAVRNEAKKAK